MTRAGAIAALCAVICACARSNDNRRLYEAIRQHDAGRVKSLVQAGADPNSTFVSTFGERQRADSKAPPPPLIVAIEEKQPEIAILLLEAGARVDARDRSGFDALERAIDSGEPRIVKALLARGADAKGASKHGFPLVFVAACPGRAAVLEELLIGGADPNARDAAGKAADHYIGTGLQNVYAELTKQTIPRASPGATPLLLAAGKGHLDVVRLLVKKGADVNARDDLGRNALMLLLEAGLGSPAAGLEIARALVDAGLDLDAKDNLGNTALMRAQRLASLAPFFAEVERLLSGAGAKE